MAVITLSASDVDAVYKELYGDGGLPLDLAERQNAFWKNVKKKGGFGGKHLVVPVRTGQVATSSDFTTAQSAATTAPTAEFNVTRGKDYAVETIDGETLATGGGGEESFVDIFEDTIERMMVALGNVAGHALYRDGWGSVGVLSSSSATSSSSVITLSNPTDAAHFHVGMRCVFSDGSDGSTPRTVSDSNNSNAAYLTVSQVDFEAGTVTFSGSNALNGVTSLATGDYVFRAGDNDRAGTSKRKITGLQGWLSQSGVSSLFGVDTRTNTLLRGFYQSSTSSIKSGILKLSEKIATYGGGRPNHVYINPINFTALSEDLGSKIEYDGGGGEADYGFAKLRMHSSAGPLTVFSDPACPQDKYFVLDMDTWVYRYAGKQPLELDKMDGLIAARKYNEDALELRGKMYGNLVCKAPGRNGFGDI